MRQIMQIVEQLHCVSKKRLNFKTV